LAQTFSPSPVHDHAHDHGHAPHGHPAQPLPWSVLRMGIASRLGLALGLSAGLWLMIWGVLR
jgi:hypothetical protein